MDKLLWDEPEFTEGKPVLLPLQLDVLERLRSVYTVEIRRAILQAACGSGKTVIASEQTRRALEKQKTILHIVHRRRLVDQMIGMLLKFGIYAAPIMEGRSTWTSPVMCASRDTLLAMYKDGQALPKADLIIVDECHVAAREVMQWYLANCRDAYWTGYTATPIKPDGKSMNPPYQKLVCCAPTSELIKIGRLCPVKVYNPDAVGRRRRKGEKVKPVGDPVAHWLKYAKDFPTVVFASSVADSLDIASRYNAAGIKAEHIDADTPELEREEVFKRSERGETKIVSNCGVMIEGVDLPWLVCCQILRGCNSLVLWVQANGRIMRAYPGKSHGICLDHSGAAHEYGMPDSDYQWTLEDGAANEKNNRPPKDRKPVSCPGCGFVFIWKPACPECGRVMPVKKRKSLLSALKPGDGVLTEYTVQQEKFMRRDLFNRLWNKVLYIGRAKGWTMGRAAAVFSKEANMPPWEAELDAPLPKGKAGWAMSVADWLRQQRAG